MSARDKIKRLWLIGLFIVLQLIMTQGYSNVTYTKYVTIGLISITLFFSAIEVWYCAWIRNNAGEIAVRKLLKCVHKRFNIVDYAVGFFFMTNVISLLASEDIAYSFVAKADKRLGFFFIVLIMMIYISIRFEGWETETTKKWLSTIPAIGFILVVVFATLQFLGVDIGFLIGRLMDEERKNFLSTLGNTSVYGKYLCMVGMFCVGRFMSEEKQDAKSNLLLGIALLLIPIGVLTSNTDATYLSYVVGAYGFMVLSLKLGAGYKYLEFISLQCLGGIIFSLLYLCTSNHRPISNLGRICVEHYYVLMVVELAIIGLIYYKRNDKEKFISVSENKRKIANLFALAAFLVIAIALALAGYFSTTGKYVDLGYFEQYLRFNDSWGTERGYVWRWMLEIFGKASLLDKLTGYGQGMVPVLLLRYYEYDMKNTLGYLFDNAHNVYLHTLISTGIIGLLSYLSIIGTLFYRFAKIEKLNIYSIAIIAALLIDVFGVYEPITTPIFWAILVLSVSSIECKQGGQAS